MKNIRHMGIVVSNIEKSLEFYVGLLGLKIKKDMLEQGDYLNNMLALEKVRVRTVKMQADDGNLVELLWYESHPRTPRVREICEIGASHVAFTVEDLDKEYERLKSKGVVFTAPPQYSPDGYAKVTFCQDPDGTFIELVQQLK